MKPSNLYALGGVPIDRAAFRSVMPGFEYEPDMKPGGALIFDAPPPMASLKHGKPKDMPAEDMSGRKFGRLTVVWHFGRKKKVGLGAASQLWTCRCLCGRYTIRTAKAIKAANPDNMCGICNHLEQIKRSELAARIGFDLVNKIEERNRNENR